jgi:hypothetical protein
LLPALAVVAIGLIAYGAVLLTRGPSHSVAVVVPPPPTTTAAAVPVQHARPGPTSAQVARAASLKLAAKLPVALDSAALLRVGSVVYVVGGSARAGGKPADTILRVNPASGRVHNVGHFLEPLADAGVARRAGILYVAGGWTGAKVGTAVLRWVPGQTATVVARLPVGLRHASAAFIGSRLYVVGGSPQKVFAVDVNSGSVATVATVPKQLQTHASNLEYLIQAQTRR